MTTRIRLLVSWSRRVGRTERPWLSYSQTRGVQTVLTVWLPAGIARILVAVHRASVPAAWPEGKKVCTLCTLRDDVGANCPSDPSCGSEEVRIGHRGGASAKPGLHRTLSVTGP